MQNKQNADAETVERNSGLSRRDFIGLGALAAAGLGLGGTLSGCSSEEAPSSSGSSVAVNENGRYDLVIKGGNVYEVGENTDLAISDGMIVATGSISDEDGREVIDATGKLVSPSFVDSHTHIDKAFAMESKEYREKLGELAEEFMADTDPSNIDYGYPVCAPAEQYLMERIKEGKSEEELKEVVKERMSRVLDMAIANGTGTLKTNNTWGALSIEVASELKEEYAGKIDLHNIVTYTANTEKGDATSLTLDQLTSYAENGQVDFIGGYFDGDYGYDTLDALFEFCDTHGLPADLHVLETDAPLLTPFDYVLDKSMAYDMGVNVTCGHLTGLDAPGIDQAALEAIVAKAAQAGINVTSLCSCNMYLMGRKAAAPRRRGITRLDLFLEEGVNSCFASDNIRDGWRPYGNADMLQEALICAHCMQYAFPEELETIYRMGTTAPAVNALCANYGAGEGCVADLVILDAASPDMAIIEQPRKLYVIKNGKVVAQDGTLV